MAARAADRLDLTQQIRATNTVLEGNSSSRPTD